MPVQASILLDTTTNVINSSFSIMVGVTPAGGVGHSYESEQNVGFLSAADVTSTIFYLYTDVTSTITSVLTTYGAAGDTYYATATVGSVPGVAVSFLNYSTALGVYGTSTMRVSRGSEVTMGWLDSTDNASRTVVVTTVNAPQNGTIYSWYYPSIPAGPYTVALFGEPKTKWFGTSELDDPTGFGTTPEDILGNAHATPMVTSTWTDSYGMATSMPAIGWGSGTGTYDPTGTFAAHLNNMAGVATNTFPICLVYPTFKIIDLVEAATLGAPVAQTLEIKVGQGATTTFSLAGAPAVFAAMGLQIVWDMLWDFLEAIAWLTFGLAVLNDLFGNNKNTNDEDD